MYFQFDLVLSDVSAFLVDGDYHWNQVIGDRTDGSSKSTVINFLPVIDKCGVIVKLQQVLTCLFASIGIISMYFL